MRDTKRLFMFIVFSCLYISDIRFFFLPEFIRTRFFLGILGLLVFCYVNKSFIIRKDIYYNIYFLLLLIIPFVLTSIVNDNFDKWGLRPILNVFVFFAAYFIILSFKKIYAEKFNLYFLILLIVFGIIFNISVALLMFYIPSFKEFVFLLQGASVSNDNRLYYSSLFRLFGLGSFFFYQAGVYCSWGLLLIVYLLKKGKSKFVWMTLYLFVLVTGMFFARTTAVGFLVSIIYFLFPQELTYQSFLRFIFKTLFLVVSLFLVALLMKGLLLEYSDDKLIYHAFEFFFNYMERGRLETASTNHLATMYVFPDNLKTWLIGDGIFTAYDGTYYKSTDVGYLRIIYFMGLFGLFVFYMQKIYLLTSSIRLVDSLNKKDYVILLFFLFMLTLILNFKGFTDLDIFVFLFFWFFLLHSEKNIYE